MVLSSCTNTVMDPRACPTERKYTKAELDALAKEYGATTPAIKAAMVDYGKLRDKARACRGVKIK